MQKLAQSSMTIALAVISTFVMTGVIGMQPAAASFLPQAMRASAAQDHHGDRGGNRQRGYGGQMGMSNGQDDQGDNTREDQNGGNGCGYYGNGGYGNGGYGNGQCNNQGPYNQGPYNQGPYNQGPYNQGPYNGSYGNGNASIHGIVTSVNGNSVRILQGLFSPITINDQIAMNYGRASNVYVTRSITAYGYWRNGIFYATSIQ